MTTSKEPKESTLKQIVSYWPVITCAVMFGSSLWIAPQLAAKDFSALDARVRILEETSGKLTDKLHELDIHLAELTAQLKISNQLLQGIKR